MFSASLEQSLLMLPLVFGIYLSYQILKATDLTVDGSFVLGAGVYARALTLGSSHIMALMLAMLAGIIAGTIVSLIQRHNKINPLVASIIMLFMLYSINFQIMGRPNINLMMYDFLDIFADDTQELVKYGILIGSSLVLSLGLYVVIKSRFGLILRAFGAHQNLLKKYNKSAEIYRIAGLSISNMLAALCGAMTAQLNGYADINMGFGMALTGIGAVVIGQQLLLYMRRHDRFNVGLDLLGCFIGIYLYFLIMHLLLHFNINPINLKLFLGILLIISLRSASLLKGGRHVKTTS